MNFITKLELVSECRPGGALYQCIDCGDGTFLLGLGLWDRANANHTKEEKDRTKGQVVRIDADGNVLARSPELSGIVYQLMPVDSARIFVGCRNGDLLYLNPDLTVQRSINFKNAGLYFWVCEDEKTLVATMREGAVLFLDLHTDDAEIVEIVDPSVRMWPILKDGDRYLAGSYRGHLAVIEGRRVIKWIDYVGQKRAAVWTLNVLGNEYLIGNARGELWNLNRNLELPVLVYQNASAITATALLNDTQIAIGDLKGDMKVVVPMQDGSVLRYPNPGKEETHSNTIWWITPDHDHGLLRVAYSNGQLRTLRAT